MDASPSRRQLGLPRRRPTKRFIPDGDSDFAFKARNFAERIKENPARFALSAEDAEQIEQAVIEFRDALAKSKQRFTRSMQMTMQKDDATCPRPSDWSANMARLIRLNENIPAESKIAVGVSERSKKPRKPPCPTTPPWLRFVRSTGDERSSEPVHVLQFREAMMAGGKSASDETVRLELFVELVSARAHPIPAHPAQLTGGWVKYLRSYTRSPIRVEFPMAQQPMRVVYWARWADSTGNVGPFCKTVVARVEGWDNMPRALPQPNAGRQRQQRIVITAASKELPDYGHEGGHGIEEVSAGVGRLLTGAME